MIAINNESQQPTIILYFWYNKNKIIKETICKKINTKIDEKKRNGGEF